MRINWCKSGSVSLLPQAEFHPLNLTTVFISFYNYAISCEQLTENKKKPQEYFTKIQKASFDRSVNDTLKQVTEEEFNSGPSLSLPALPQCSLFLM